MRISTPYFQKAGTQAILDQQAEISRTQLQLSTGKRILAPSDAPVDAEQALEMHQALDRVEQYNRNADRADLRLKTEEGVLKGMETQLFRAKELAIQAANDTYSHEDRQAIALELKQILNELIELGNATDGNGEYLFAGTKTTTEPFSLDEQGHVIYQGDDGQRFLKVGENRTIAISDSGFSAFMDLRNGNGDFTAAAVGGNSGTGVIDPGSVTDYSAFTGEDYTIVFTQSTEAAVDPSGTTIGVITDDAVAPAVDNDLRYELIINGHAVPVHDEAGAPITDMAELADAINGEQATTGVVAYVDTEGNLRLANADNSDASPITVQERLYDGGGVALDTGDSMTGYFGGVLQGDGTATEVLGEELVFETSAADSYVVLNSASQVVHSGEYQPEAGIQFNGMTTNVRGEPGAGDRFTIQASRRQDLFTTMENLIAAVEYRVADNTENADFRNAINRALTDLSRAVDKVSEVRATVGSRLNAVESQKDVNEYFTLQAKEIISDLEDLDYTEAISRFNLQMVGLQAAQQAYVKVQGLSLFNYIS